MWTEPGEAGVDLAENVPVVAVLVDGRLSGALDQVQAVKAAEPNVPVILVASSYSSQEEIQARRIGAFYCMIEKSAYGNLRPFLVQASALENK